MKLVRYGAAGKEKPGLIDADGKLRDLSRKVKDIDGASLAPGRAGEAEQARHRRSCRWSRASRASDPASPRRRSSSPSASTSSTTRRKPTHRSPSPRSSSSRPRPRSWDLTTASSCRRARRTPIGKWSWVSSSGVPRVSFRAKDAPEYVAGYCLINDVSERDYQMHRGGSQWSKGKGCDTFGPIGPWLVTHRRDPAIRRTFDMWLDVNGVAEADRQHADDDLRRCAALVADVSQLHDAASRRRHHHGHSARRGVGHEADRNF